MAEDLRIGSGSREAQYQALLPQVQGLLTGEPDMVANMANLAAALHEQFGWLWVGFYMVKQEELVLGPFQGPVACTRIRKGKGVCGAAWERAETIIVPDVHQFPGHIACSSRSRSEIVIPLIVENRVWAVLDIDAEELSEFSGMDARYLSEMLQWIQPEG